MKHEKKRQIIYGGEKKRRSLVKSLSWRLLSVVVTVSVAWIITGNTYIAAGIGSADALIKLGIYYLHERFWGRLKFGRIEYAAPEYEI